MAHRALIAALPLLLLLAPTAQACTQVYFGPHRSLLADSGSSHWTYNNNGADWPGTCAEGEKQSPIAIPSTKALTGQLPAELRASLDFGTVSGLKVINTGHAIQVEWDTLTNNKASIATVDDAIDGVYDLTDAKGAKASSRVPLKPLQFHFHANSEHLLDGADFPLELHLVTQVDNTTGAPVPSECIESKCLAVFGVMYRFSADPYANGSALVDLFVNNAPLAVGATNAKALPTASLNLGDLFPDQKDYATYTGSLTTPPCSEGVTWHVFLQSKAVMSSAQRDKLQAVMANTLGTTDECQVGSSSQTQECTTPTGSRVNNRQVMPINDRSIFLSASA